MNGFASNIPARSRPVRRSTVTSMPNSPVIAASMLSASPVARCVVRNTTLPLWMYVSTCSNPSDSYTLRSLDIGIVRPATFTARSIVAYVAIAEA